MDLSVRKSSAARRDQEPIQTVWIKQEVPDDVASLPSSCIGYKIQDLGSLPQFDGRGNQSTISPSIYDAPLASSMSHQPSYGTDSPPSLADDIGEAHSQIDKCEVCNKAFGTGNRQRSKFHSKLHGLELVICSVCCASIQSRQGIQDVKMEEDFDEDDAEFEEYGTEEDDEMMLPQHASSAGKEMCSDKAESKSQSAVEQYQDDDHKLEDFFAVSSVMIDPISDSESQSGSEGQDKVKRHKCLICLKSFAQRGCLTRHIKIHSGEKPFQCDLCSKTFSRSSNLQSHVRTVHVGDKRYECHICKKIFGHGSWLKRHLRTHTGEKQYKCDFCNKWVSSSTSLQSHMRTHTGEKPYKCPICNKGFSVKCTLTVHMRIHTGEKPYECQVCHTYFAQGSQLKAHLKTHPDVTMEQFQCEICQKEFTRKYDLNMHLKVHTEGSIFDCKFCNEQFNSLEKLEAHLPIHLDERTYQCDICDKSFNRKDNLKEHLKIHTGERPYQCQVCSESFINCSHLKVHMRIHTGERPYQCNVCGKSFTQSSTLKSHKRIHTGEKPFRCHICNDLFTRATSVKKHIMRAHREVVEAAGGISFVHLTGLAHHKESS